MNKQAIIDLYTDLATNPEKNFGWEKGLQNAINHSYKDEWIASIPKEIWNYCIAVGNPFIAGELQEGEIVLDLGCGAGVDLCVASLLVGEKGYVYGTDITPAMVERAQYNISLAGLSNITVHECSIELLPVDDNSINTVISNGAINLVNSKETAFSEIYRILMKGGRLYLADMIRDDNARELSCCVNESWANCIAGTLTSDELIQLLTQAGFVDIQFLGTNHYKTADSTIGAAFSAKKA